MEANKLQVKFFFDVALSRGIVAHHPEAGADGARVNFEAFVVVFHDWIRRGALNELVIDVADYSHVEHGPGVVLVGHASDYYIDNLDGQPGLLYSRKRSAPRPDERLKDAFRRAAAASQLLTQESTLAPLEFRTNEVLIRVPDRLSVSNDRAGFESVREELQTFAGWLYSGAKIELEQLGMPTQPLMVMMRTSAAPELGALVERLGGTP